MKNALVVVSSVPASSGDGIYSIDEKFSKGVSSYADQWPGPVHVINWSVERDKIAFGRDYRREDLNFSMHFVGEDQKTIADLLENCALVLAVGDDHRHLALMRQVTAPVVYLIEYTLDTRVRIKIIESGISIKLAKAVVWLLKTEAIRRKAFRRCAGLQSNGTPAFAAYSRIAPHPMLYFDNRTRLDQQITLTQVERKIDEVREGRGLRLAFSGRLEPMKGADHLIPVAKHLAALKIPFTFDIFGSGSLEANIRDAIAGLGLGDVVTLHAPVPFDEVLVPTLKDRIDLFVCCHRQGDPSCTYVETLACGVPIVGYANAAFKGLLKLGDFGVAVPMDQQQALAREIVALHQDRARLGDMMRAAADFAREHTFEATFERRVHHMKSVAKLQDRQIDAPVAEPALP